MLLVQEHQIHKNHKYYNDIDHLCFLSKNLYNAANYFIRQHYLNTDKDPIPSNTNKYLNYYDINRYMVDTKNVDYYQFPGKVANGILRQLDKNYISFFNFLKDYNSHPQKYLGRPKLPKYKHIKSGRNIIPYQKMALSKKQFNQTNEIKFSGTNIKIKTKLTSWSDIQAARIIPTYYGYKIDIIYNQYNSNKINNNNILGLDLGVNNLVAGATNINKSFLIKGTIIKSINHYYNKKKAELQSQLPKDQYTSKQITKLTNKRNNKINNYLHKTSKTIINYCLTNNIGKIIVGHNDNWKQNINMSKINNQTFVQIPFNILINQLKYKCQLNGLQFLITEESYTSKCSFIDDQSIQKHQNYLGKRIKRGLFKTNNGSLINADINGALNIIKKVYPLFNVNNTLYHGLQGIAVYPLRLLIY